MINPIAGVFNRRNMAVFYHRVVLGAAGAIASQDAPADSGIVATKTATETGRYTLQMPSKYRRLLWAQGTIIGPDDAVLGANTTGYGSFVRDNDIDGGAADGTVEIQFTQTSYADAEVANNLTLLFRVEVEF